MRVFYTILLLCGLSLGCSASPTTTPPSEQNTEPTGLQGITNAHNKVRENVSPAPNTPLPALKWSSKLAQSAQAWAEKCKWEHSQTEGTGENLFAGTGNYKPEQVIDSWAKEAENYDYNTNKCAAGKVCGHYTQIVWKSTQEVGCGMASCKGLLGGTSIAQFWVCQYTPPGNFVGQKPY